MNTKKHFNHFEEVNHVLIFILEENLNTLKLAIKSQVTNHNLQPSTFGLLTFIPNN